MPSGDAAKKYTPKLAQEILTRLSEGESLLSICKSDIMPSLHTVREWAAGTVIVADKDNFPTKYAQARERQADTYFDEVIELADGVAFEADIIAQEAADKVEDQSRSADTYRRVYNEEIQARKLRIDSRKWALGRMSGRYVERQKHSHSGDPDAPPVQIESKTKVELGEKDLAAIQAIAHRALQGVEE